MLHTFLFAVWYTGFRDAMRILAFLGGFGTCHTLLRECLFAFFAWLCANACWDTLVALLDAHFVISACRSMFDTCGRHISARRRAPFGAYASRLHFRENRAWGNCCRLQSMALWVGCFCIVRRGEQLKEFFVAGPRARPICLLQDVRRLMHHQHGGGCQEN